MSRNSYGLVAMQQDVARLNGEVNRATRSLHAIAVMLKGGRIEAVADHVRNIASALEALKRLQAELWNANPELEFHYDGTRPDSEYMRVYRRHLRRAAEYEAAGDKRRALRQLESALQMELPPLPHEVVTKEIARIASDAG